MPRAEVAGWSSSCTQASGPAQAILPVQASSAEIGLFSRLGLMP